jgi:hypothetical protein
MRQDGVPSLVFQEIVDGGSAASSGARRPN